MGTRWIDGFARSINDMTFLKNHEEHEAVFIEYFYCLRDLRGKNYGFLRVYQDSNRKNNLSDIHII